MLVRCTKIPFLSTWRWFVCPRFPSRIVPQERRCRALHCSRQCKSNQGHPVPSISTRLCHHALLMLTLAMASFLQRLKRDRRARLRSIQGVNYSNGLTRGDTTQGRVREKRPRKIPLEKRNLISGLASFSFGWLRAWPPSPTTISATTLHMEKRLAISNSRKFAGSDHAYHHSCAKRVLKATADPAFSPSFPIFFFYSLRSSNSLSLIALFVLLPFHTSSTSPSSSSLWFLRHSLRWLALPFSQAARQPLPSLLPREGSSAISSAKWTTR